MCHIIPNLVERAEPEAHDRREEEREQKPSDQRRPESSTRRSPCRGTHAAPHAVVSAERGGEGKRRRARPFSPRAGADMTPYVQCRHELSFRVVSDERKRARRTLAGRRAMSRNVTVCHVMPCHVAWHAMSDGGRGRGGTSAADKISHSISHCVTLHDINAHVEDVVRGGPSIRCDSTPRRSFDSMNAHVEAVVRGGGPSIRCQSTPPRRSFRFGSIRFGSMRNARTHM